MATTYRTTIYGDLLQDQLPWDVSISNKGPWDTR